jgi:uncharacterized protein (DUF433 family)
MRNHELCLNEKKFVKITVYSPIAKAILTMLLKELETQLLALTPTDKAEVLRLITQSLNNSWPGITKTPEVCGGDACIAKTRLPVWLFVSLRSQGATDADILQFYPYFNAENLVNVWTYAEANSEEIETALREEETAMMSVISH